MTDSPKSSSSEDSSSCGYGGCCYSRSSSPCSERGTDLSGAEANNTDSIFKRIENFTKDWKEFLRYTVNANYESHFSFWFLTVGKKLFIKEMLVLTSRHFNGALSAEADRHFKIFVRMLGFGLQAFQTAVKDAGVEAMITFLEEFSQEAFNEMEWWNSTLYSYRKYLEPYESEKDPLERGPEVPLEDGEELQGAGRRPAWIQVVEGEEAATGLDETDLSEIP